MSEEIIRRPYWRGLTRKIDEQTKRELWELMRFEPHEGQIDIAFDRHRHKVLCAGRRYGKSLLAASEANIVMALGGHVWVVAPTYELAEVIFENAVALAEGTEYSRLLAKAPRMARGQQRMVTVTGGRIDAKSSEKPNSLLGRGIDLLIFDEASKEADPKVWTQYLTPTMSDRLGGSLVISTPTGDDWFKDRWDLGNPMNKFKDASIMSWHHTSLDNPHFDPEEYYTQQRLLPDRIFRQEYLAEFLQNDGGVFRGFKEIATERMLVDADGNPAPVPGGDRYVIGVDLAKYNDWTVICVMDAAARKMVYYERFNQIEWNRQRRRILEVSKAFRAPMLIDATGVGDPVVEELTLSGHPYPIEGFKFSAINKQQIMNQLAIGIEQKELTILDEPILLQELGAYRYERTDKGNLSMSAPPGKTDDFVVALALAWQMCHRYGGSALPITVLDPRFASEEDGDLLF